MISTTMIQLTRLNSSKIFLNPDLMRSIEETPDTIISLVNGEQFLVREKAVEVIEKIVAFRVAVLRQAGDPSSLLSPGQCVTERTA